MVITTLCAIVISLKILPNRSQFFQYESVTVSCTDPRNSSDWTVKRNTSTNKNEECSTGKRRNQSHCFLEDIYPQDSGEYWCESGAGECSEVINITVTGGSVILESPVSPLQEGQTVNLRCKHKTSLFNLTAEFYKDGRLIGNSSTGTMTIHDVSSSNEGLYKCKIAGNEESADSWLAVRAGEPGSFQLPLTPILFPVVGVCLTLMLLFPLCLWRKNIRDEKSCEVSYIDVTITSEVRPSSHAENTAEPTVYSTIKPRAI